MRHQLNSRGAFGLRFIMKCVKIPRIRNIIMPVKKASARKKDIPRTKPGSILLRIRADSGGRAVKSSPAAIYRFRPISCPRRLFLPF